MIPGKGKRFSLLQNTPTGVWGSPKLLLNGYSGLFTLGAKWPGCEVDQPPVSSTKVKNNGGVFVCSLHLPLWHTQGQIYGDILLPLVSNESFCNEVKIHYTDSVMLHLPWKVIV